MLKARIYCPSRTAMQQGRAKTHRWLLEFEAARARPVITGQQAKAEEQQQGSSHRRLPGGLRRRNPAKRQGDQTGW